MRFIIKYLLCGSVYMILDMACIYFALAGKLDNIFNNKDKKLFKKFIEYPIWRKARYVIIGIVTWPYVLLKGAFNELRKII